MKDSDIKNSRELFKRINAEFYKRYSRIDDSDEFWDFMAKPLRQSIRVNTIKGEVREVLDLLKEKYGEKFTQIPWCEEGFFSEAKISGSSIEHQLGLIFFQEASSMIPPTVMNVKRKSRILDIAAAPGAKTTQIAQYVNNDAMIVANDVKYSRINVLISNLQRCSAIAHVTMCDGRNFRKYPECFDYVLLDAPCSNTGMVRKNYKYAKIWKINEVLSLSKLQKQLILAAYETLKSGGTLVYSTCTIEPLENEEVIDHLLSNTDARLEKVRVAKGVEPITEFEGRVYSDEVRKCLRIHPQCNDTEGFFVAKIIKP
ncbi:MAG: tRNA methyltransferase [Archaeoglobus sp.]|nr:MAG: tRNA methyltransferase [Archaeoglobus sp.]